MPRAWAYPVSYHRIVSSETADLDEIRQNWEAFGRDDPLWAILTVPAMRGGLWDPAAFMATGEDEVADMFRQLEDLGVTVNRGRALDFGCGAGRLTRALAARFESVVGVDVADAMLDKARALNADLHKVTWTHNTRSDLAVIPDRSIDFIYSNLVLQHMPPTLSMTYVQEFGRVLASAGCAVFQVPAVRPAVSEARPGRPLWRRIARRARRELARVSTGRKRPAHEQPIGASVPPGPRMLYFGVPRQTVDEAVRASGALVVAEISKSTSVGWPGTLYVIRRA